MFSLFRSRATALSPLSRSRSPITPPALSRSLIAPSSWSRLSVGYTISFECPHALRQLSLPGGSAICHTSSVWVLVATAQSRHVPHLIDASSSTTANLARPLLPLPAPLSGENIRAVVLRYATTIMPSRGRNLQPWPPSRPGQ
jgi:hypothetical protein